MPELNGMQCRVEIGPHSEPLLEQCAVYSDRSVGCLVCIPCHDIAFNIHLSADLSIAPGLAIFVFIDGHYQANRNITGLAGAEDLDHTTSQIHMRLRQKEEVAAHNASLVGREWCFSRIKTGALRYLRYWEQSNTP